MRDRMTFSFTDSFSERLLIALSQSSMMLATPSFNCSVFSALLAFLSAWPNFTASLCNPRTRNRGGCTSFWGYRSAKEVAPPVSTKPGLRVKAAGLKDVTNGETMESGGGGVDEDLRRVSGNSKLSEAESAGSGVDGDKNVRKGSGDISKSSDAEGIEAFVWDTKGTQGNIKIVEDGGWRGTRRHRRIKIILRMVCDKVEDGGWGCRSIC